MASPATDDRAARARDLRQLRACFAAFGASQAAGQAAVHEALIGTSIRGPRRRDALLALAGPYVRWLAPRRHPGDDFGWAP